mmetsp:Transcript_53894/g.129885  ORF Transcript_53894/g.129885 Transcript_53894/m.129885 type:complete len:508 (+) Transcript_53894:1582-3105(+)
MDIAAHAHDVLREDVDLGWLDALRHAVAPARVHDGVQLLRTIQVGHVTCVEDIVDVLEHALEHDLRVSDEEDHLLLIDTRTHQAVLHVLAELRLAVALGQLDLEQLVVSHEGRKPRQGLTARATNTHEQSVTLRLSDHTAHASDVANGIKEHHEVHRGLAFGVEVGQVLFDGRLQLRDVCHLLIHLRVSAHDHEVAKDDTRLRATDGIPIAKLGQVRLRLRLQEGVEPAAILVVDQTVAVHPQTLMDPHTAHGRGVRNAPRVRHQNALQYLAQITQVEGVVRLRRRRQQVVDDRRVHAHTGCHDGIRRRPDALVERPQEVVQDGAEDEGHRLIVHLCVVDHVEVAEETGRHRVASAAGRTKGRQQDAVDDTPEHTLLAVIPALVIAPLPQQLDRRLRKVLLALRHVQVVNEDDVLAASDRTIDTTSTLLQLAVDGVLGLVRTGLRRERDGHRDELGWHLRRQQLVQVHGLTRTRRPTHQDVLVIHQEQLCEVLVPNRVLRGDDQLCE